MSDEMKRELNGLRTELHDGLGELRQDMHEIRSMFRRTMIEVAKLTGTIVDLKHDVATKDDVSLLKGYLDDFAGEVAVSRRERTLQDKSFNFLNGHLSDHEARLVRLERQEKKS